MAARTVKVWINQDYFFTLLFDPITFCLSRMQHKLILILQGLALFFLKNPYCKLQHRRYDMIDVPSVFAYGMSLYMLYGNGNGNGNGCLYSASSTY